MFKVTPEFKEIVSQLLGTKKFTLVFSYMNLINREGFEYTEAELNSFVQFIGEFAYVEVAEFFANMYKYVTPMQTSDMKNDTPEITRV